MLKKQGSTHLFRPMGRRAKKPLPSKRSAIMPGTTRASAKHRARDIGIWDIDANAGFLYRVLDKLNQRQRLFKFARIETTVPTGLMSSGDRTRQIIKAHGGDPTDPEIAKGVLAPDILSLAKPMVKRLGTNLLVCVVKPKIIDFKTMEEDGEEGVGLDYFSTSYKDVVVVSACGLRRYATKAGRPFEAALAAVVLGAVLAGIFPKVGFHDETRGCIMDYCDNRDDIVAMLRNIAICAESLAEIPEDAQSSVDKMLDVIREYRR